MEGMMQVKIELEKSQQMEDENPREQEVEDCVVLRASAKIVVNLVKETYDDFKTQQNTPIASN